MNFFIRKCDSKDTGTVVRLIETVYERMEHKEWFAADNSAYTEKMLSTGRGTAWMAVEEESGRPAGVFLAAFPSAAGGKAAASSDASASAAGDAEADEYDENLGRDIGLPEEALGKVAHMDSAAVLPEFCGFHLQRRLMETAEEALRRQGFRYLCCTVHPDNQASLKSVLSQGYRIMKTCEKYGGSPRHILLKVLE